VSDGQALTFDIEGQLVTCYQTDGDRLWRCECAYFQRTLAMYNRGFCPHIVVAIWQVMQGSEGGGSNDL
jgi:hypothetical protein